MTGERLDGRYAKLWAASTTSALGSGLATVAAPLLIASRTDEPLVVSGGFAVAWLPWLLFSLPGGVLADRVDRRKLMITLDWIRVPAVALLAVAISMGDVSIALLYAVLFVINACEVVFRTSSGAMLPAIVPKALLERANGRLYAGTTLAHGMLSGPLSGFLFGVAASIPFYVNAGTYAVSALLLGLIAGAYRSRPVEPAARRSMRSEVAEGFRWLAGQRLLRTMIGLIGMLNLTLVAATSVLVLLAKERLQLGSVGYGLLFTCMAVGGLLGSVMGDRLIAWCTPTWTLRIGLLIEAGTHLVLATSTSAPVVGVTLFLFGVHGALWGIVGSSLRQRLTPPGMLGRVGSTSLFVIAGGNCVGALLGGAVASTFGLTTPYWAGFVVAVIVSALTWRVFDREVVSAAYAQEPTVSR
ncbi:MFS transporter [Amycolatopsis roodepoortensis]|uniref:MFS family permease n=1 Tax=Amycolatopsis roodepoortensis TaxID=700274 RepID=A0ABR9L1Q5_9PSEU|nr:MFS transporter [Amycolatopsis roodepoortensis]MBE1574561.1 MFS family permease [Amycolatopsis roodepoortensis]